jgi:hypothetical protein
MIQIHTFKEKEKGGEGKPQLGGLWKVPCLVVLEKKREAFFSPLLTFPPTILLKPSFFH